MLGAYETAKAAAFPGGRGKNRPDLLIYSTDMSAQSSVAPNELRYPIGRYRPPQTIDQPTRAAWIVEIDALPANLRQSLADLNEAQLDTPYRPGGWTVRQVVHHVADSHLNSYTRFKFALTEESPAIKTYDEAVWAELPDARTAAPGVSLTLLEALHARWALLLRAMTGADFARSFRHAEHGEVRLDWALGLYAWHSRHHVAHILNLRRREGW